VYKGQEYHPGQIDETEMDGVYLYCEPSATGFQLTNQRIFINAFSPFPPNNLAKPCYLEPTPNAKLKEAKIGYVSEQNPEMIWQCVPGKDGYNVIGTTNVTRA
jgi:hypothetical protein